MTRRVGAPATGSVQSCTTGRATARAASRVVHRRGDRGSATLAAMGVIGLLLVLGAALGVVGAMVHAHRVAQSAADLAALAGAESHARGEDACTAAADLADANGATLVRCEVADGDVRVRVQVTGPRWLGQDHDLLADARAGPATRAPP